MCDEFREKKIQELIDCSKILVALVDESMMQKTTITETQSFYKRLGYGVARVEVALHDLE